MASEDGLLELIRLGPFLGLDQTTAPIYVKPGMSAEASNCNTQIVKGGLTAERGRTELFDAAAFLFGTVRIQEIKVIFPVVGPGNKPGVLFQGNAIDGTLCTGYYDYSGTFTNVTNGRKFTQAVQYGQVVYTNGGQRFFVGNDNTKLYDWQYTASSIAQNVTINWTYAIATLGFSGYIKSGDVLTINITSSAAATINYTVKDTDISFDVLSKSIVKAVNDYYATGAGSGVANKITAAPLVNFNTALQPGTVTAGLANGILLTSTASGNIGNTFTISVSSSVGSTEGFQLTGPTALGFFYGANVEVGNMLGGEYFYLFTQQTTMPDGTVSETSVDPSNYANPLQVHVGGATYGSNSAVTFNDNHSAPTYKFTGTNADGSTYTTNIYRQSTNQAQAGYFLVGNKADNLTPFIDRLSDQDIQGNAQLQVHRDPPPFITGSTLLTNLGFIAIHHNRIWAFVVEDNNLTTNLAQVQLWYSNFDRPWEFNDVDQVLLLQTDANPAPETGGPNYDDLYGNYPKGLCEVGTTLIALKRRETWVVWGDGSTSNPFVAKPIFNFGAISSQCILPVIGGMFWLSESGDLYFYAGGAPQYDSEDIRGALKLSSVNVGVTMADMVQACASYSNRALYLSFPTKGFTLGYDTIDGHWMSTLPYAPPTATAIATTVANPASIAANLPNEVLAVRGGEPVVVDQWFSDPNQDIGNTYQIFSWTIPITDCGKAEFLKWFASMRVTAPKHFGTITGELTVDDDGTPQSVFKATVDLNGSQISKTALFKGNTDKAKGFVAQLKITVQGLPNKPAPVIWAVQVFGNLDKRLPIQT